MIRLFDVKAFLFIIIFVYLRFGLLFKLGTVILQLRKEGSEDSVH